MADAVDPRRVRPAPRRRTAVPYAAALRRAAALRLAAALLLAALAPVWSHEAAAEPLDLAGTWYVLIHYKDPETANPDAERWKDLVWVFARKGTRLEWTEYPLVAFEDTTGRFESLGGNPRSRVLAFWQPNAQQAAAIAAGPRVNPLGTKTKTLQGSDARGWRSARGAMSSAANVIGYQQNLSIDGLDALPLFLRSDVVGNESMKKDGGGTRYEVETIRRDGDELVGRYTRDGRQSGTFKMWRTPPVRGLPEKPKSSDSPPPARE